MKNENFADWFFEMIGRFLIISTIALSFGVIYGVLR